jgi:DNA-binding XRE family transcriptional regulator
MKSARRKKLEAAGWHAGSAEEFLGLTREEAELVELKLALSSFLKRLRQKKRLTQEALAERLGSSQSRVAKLEAGSRGTTLDLLFRALFAAGVTTDVIVREMGHRRRHAA